MSAPFTWGDTGPVTPQQIAAEQQISQALIATAQDQPQTMWSGIQNASAKIGGALLNQKAVGDYRTAQKDYSDKFASALSSNPSLSDIEMLASNPFANQGQSAVVQALLGQKFQLQSPDAIAQRALIQSEITKNAAEASMMQGGGKLVGGLQPMSDGTFTGTTEYGGVRHFGPDGGPLSGAPGSGPSSAPQSIGIPGDTSQPTAPLTGPATVAPTAAPHILTPAEIEQKKALTTGLTTDLIANRKDAMAANDLQQYVQEGRALISQPSLTGAGADYKIAALKWAASLGIPVDQTAVNNSESFKAVMGQAVGQIIKQFGSGTGLSDADRQYAQNIAGGNIELNKAAILKILDMAERNAQSRIDQYQQQLTAFQTGDTGKMLSLPTPTGAIQPPAAGKVLTYNPNTGELE